MIVRNVCALVCVCALYCCRPKRGLDDFEALTFYSNKLFTSANKRNLTHVNCFEVDGGFAKTFNPHRFTSIHCPEHILHTLVTLCIHIVIHTFHFYVLVHERNGGSLDEGLSDDK